MLFKTLIILCFVFFSACSSKPKILDISSKNNIELNKDSKILIVKQKKTKQQLARFDYYANNTPVVLEMQKRLLQKGYNVKAMPLTLFNTSSVDDIKEIAKRYDVDKIIVLKENYEVKGSLNIFALGYLTIIGMYIFPGNNMSSACTLDADIYDVKNNTSTEGLKVETNSGTYLYRIGNSESVIRASMFKSGDLALNIILDKFNIEAK